MPRFFFDLYDGDRLMKDHEGLEMDSIDAARAGAVISLAETAKDELPGGNRREFTVVVREDSGVTVLRATLTLVVEEGSH